MQKLARVPHHKMQKLKLDSSAALPSNIFADQTASDNVAHSIYQCY